jgi:hypothetical protein
LDELRSLVCVCKDDRLIWDDGFGNTLYNQAVIDMFVDISQRLITPHHCDIFLEEPEQNLFPPTQGLLINHLMELTEDHRHHRLFIATHSPYILGKMLERTDYDFGLFYIQPSNDGMSEVREATEHDIQEIYERLLYWAPIYTVNHGLAGNANIYPRQAVFSRDGRYAYINVYDVAGKRSQIVRVGGFADVNYADRAYDRYDLLKTNDGFQPNSPLTYEVLTLGGSQWLNRPVSNIIVDGHANADRLVLTFETYNDATGNVAIVNNASTSANLQWISTPDPKMPVYTALVEDSTRRIYIGTADGVFYREPNGTTWNTYANLTGVPVTAIVQQTYNLPIRRNLTHTGINANNYVFAKTKWPRAMYFGTYGRGIFVDMQYVTDLSNEVVDSVDYTPVGIPTVQNVGMNSVKLYPNPVYGEAHLAVNACVAGNGVMRVYDLNGRLAMERNLGFVTEGEHTVSFGTEGMSKGMYLINVIIGGHTATAKMMVR